MSTTVLVAQALVIALALAMFGWSCSCARTISGACSSTRRRC
ncbi:MAG TPA: hypothetical protein VL051_14020 [Burkholderiaceae bacterium]|nr:hypothetical protein [Burkholderiaceae bacterium]